MASIDDILQKAGVNIPFEKLPYYERERILVLVNASKGKSLTIENVQEHIYALKLAVERELSEVKDVPSNWVGILVLFIPIIGIIRKWYQDRQVLYLQARLTNYILIYNIFAHPKAAERQLEVEIGNLARSIAQQQNTTEGR